MITEFLTELTGRVARIESEPMDEVLVRRKEAIDKAVSDEIQAAHNLVELAAHGRIGLNPQAESLVARYHEESRYRMVVEKGPYARQRSLVLFSGLLNIPLPPRTYRF